MTNTATIIKTSHTGNIAKNRKENNFYEQLTLVTNEIGQGMKELAQVRFYATKASHYACVWINDSASNTHISGGGKASGYGYHRASAALQSAFADAGVLLNDAIDGRGEGAMRDALTAIAIALEYTQFIIIDSHA